MANATILHFIHTANTDETAEEIANISVDAVLQCYRDGDISAEQAISSITHYRDAIMLRDYILVI